MDANFPDILPHLSGLCFSRGKRNAMYRLLGSVMLSDIEVSHAAVFLVCCRLV